MKNSVIPASKMTNHFYHQIVEQKHATDLYFKVYVVEIYEFNINYNDSKN